MHTICKSMIFLNQGCILFQAGIVVCCQQKNMLTGHRVDRKISFCFFSLYCRVVSCYHHTHVHRSRASLYLEYSCLNKPTTQKKWAKIFVVGCIFFFVYVVVCSVLWKVFALWNYLGVYNNLFFFLRVKGRKKGEHWSYTFNTSWISGGSSGSA